MPTPSTVSRARIPVRYKPVTRRSGRYGLTQLQHDLMLVIQELIALGGGVGPSLRELSAETGASRSGVQLALCALRTRGHVDWLDFRARSLQVRVPLPFPADLHEVRPRLKVLHLPGRHPIPIRRRSSTPAGAAPGDDGR